MSKKAPLYGILIAFTFTLTSFNKANEKVNSASVSYFAATINSFSPTLISAGTGSLLTISGIDFGTTRGAVLFRDADNGGSSFTRASTSEIISWNATTIVVKVPQDAGTGQISVIANGTQIYSNDILTIKYAVLDGTTPTGIEPIRITNDNGTGGYTFQMETSFDGNAPAKASFKRALESWKCATGINWLVGQRTTVNTVAIDDVNVIKFGGTGEIEPGILGYTQSSWRRCSNGKWELRDIDMVYNIKDYSWNYTTGPPASNQFDFETVALHELGHAHSLGHVINPLDPMHYAIGYGAVNRTLSALDIEGGNFVINYSSTALSGSCSSPLITIPNGSCNAAEPTITSFTPTTGSTNTQVIITGANFSNTLGVSFGDVPASSFTIVSANTINARVANGATGNVSVTTPGGIAIASGFTYTSKLAQTLMSTPLPVKTYGDSDFDPGVTSSAGLPISYSSNNPLVATIVNNKIHIVGAGTAIITASQDGNTTYAPATSINLNLTVNKASQVITFPAISAKNISDSDFDPGATASSSLPITYSSSDVNVAILVAGKIRIIGAGTATIIATQAGNANFAAANAVAVQLVVNKLTQTISFPALSAKEINTADFDPGASSSSGLTITYTSSDQTVATIIGGKIHIVGAGTSTITATQFGNTTYGAAPSVAVQLVVNKMNQSIAFPVIGLKNYNDTDFDPLATATSGLAVSYSSSNPTVATIVGGKIHLIASGTTVITASQAGNNNFNAAANVSQSLDVVFTLPVNNFNLKTTDETCRTSNNGTINISAAQNLNYIASVTTNGEITTYPFNTTLMLNNLQAGLYTVCITVIGQPNYKQCYDLVIKEPKELAVYAILNENRNSVRLQLEGSSVYNIEVNGQMITTSNQEISVPLLKGINIIKVSSNLSCQGVITKTFLKSNTILVYPNPAKEILNISTESIEVTRIKIELYALDGRLVHSSELPAQYGKVSVDLNKLNKGFYVLALTIGSVKTVHKVIKE